jgi:hypothetical protein
VNHLQKQIVIILLVALLLAGCGPAVPAASIAATAVPETETSIPTTVPTLNWLGMQYSADSWQAEPVADNFLVHGMFTHLTLPDCQAILLASDPIYVVDKLPYLIPDLPEDWLTNTQTADESTDHLMIHLVTVKDEANEELLSYYDVSDKTGFFGYDLYRLGYFLMGRSPDPEPCQAAFWEVLITLQVSDWTRLPGVDQG